MTFQAAPDVAEIALTLSSNSRDWTTIYHADCHHTPTDQDLFDLGEVFENWWDGNLHDYFSTFTTPVSVRVTDISQDGGHQLLNTVFDTATGSDTAGAAPNSVGAVVTWRSDQIGRSYRGRTFFGGIPVDKFDGNEVDPTYVAALASACYVLTGAIATAGFTQCILSRWHDKALRTTALAVPITAAVGRLWVAHQRRRVQP